MLLSTLSNNTIFEFVRSLSVLTAAIVCCCLMLRRFIRAGGRLPPGPLGVPLLGALPFMGKHPQIKMSEWGRKYGDVYSLYFGRQLAVVLNDSGAIRKAFVENASAFSGRPSGYVYETMTDGDKMSEGSQWRDERRFFLQTFHELGVRSLGGFEQNCIDEAQCLVNQLVGKNGLPLDPGLEIATSVANIIWSLIFGHRLGRDNALLHDFLRNQNTIAQQLMQVGPVQALPFLRHLQPLKTQWNNFLSVVRTQQRLTTPFIDAIMKQFASRSTKPADYDNRSDSGFSSNSSSDDDETLSTTRPNSVVEHMLAHRAALNGNSALHACNYTDKKIMVAVNNLFGAGTETTVTTLKWAVLFLAHFPDKQKKVFKEIYDAVGLERPVLWADRSRLPYCEAFLMETMRRASVVPLGVVRRTTCDVHFDGYFIPKDTFVFPNLWNVHTSEKNFHEPREFRPERMLDEKTGFLASSIDDDSGLCSERSKCMPFSVGKRSCVGESIARMAMFVVFANYVQQVKVEGDGALPSIDEFTTGITVHPTAYKVRVQLRKD